MVISLATSLINKSNSGISGFTSSPKTHEFKLSASIVKWTACSTNFGCDFNFLPVSALPVNVTMSWVCTKSKIPLALPQINCNAPSGKIFDAIISLNTASVKYEVIVAGFTMAGTPANKLTAIFSNIPQTGKLNALM